MEGNRKTEAAVQEKKFLAPKCPVCCSEDVVLLHQSFEAKQTIDQLHCNACGHEFERVSCH